jgi:hypothetical protein
MSAAHPAGVRLEVRPCSVNYGARHSERRIAVLDRKINGPMVIGAATVVALVLYGLIRWLWVTPIAEMNGEDKAVGWANVVIVTILVGLVAWGVAVLLKRAGKARWFPAIGSTALAISIIGPSYLADGSSAVALILLHVAVAVVLIVGLTRVILPVGWWEQSRQADNPSSLTS